MKRILTLLEQKNHYLEKFVSLNEVEINRFMADDFDGLEHFYNQREQILEIIRYIDSQVNLDQGEIDSTTVNAADKETMKELMRIKNLFVNQIIQQDLEILACIDHAKSGIIRELQDLKKTKKAVSGYKSPQFTKRLNEEA